MNEPSSSSSAIRSRTGSLPCSTDLARWRSGPPASARAVAACTAAACRAALCRAALESSTVVIVREPIASRSGRRRACDCRAGGRAPAGRRATRRAARRGRPRCAMPISSSIETRSSLAILPVAPAGTGQPPSSPKLDSNDSTPASSAASTLASPCPRVLWKWAVSSMPGSAGPACSKKSRTCSGLAMPVVSPKPTSSAPASASSWAIASTRPGCTCPSYGQPNEVEITPSQRRPSARARAKVRRRPSSDSATERPTFFWLCVSDADRKPLISWNFARCSSALSRPFSLGISTLALTRVGQCDALEHLAGVGELGDHVGAHEARQLDALKPRGREQLDQAHLDVGGQHLGLVLEAVARTRPRGSARSPVARPLRSNLRTCGG